MSVAATSPAQEHVQALSDVEFTVAAQSLHKFPSLGSSGLSCRKPTRGAEYELVEEYIKSKLFSVPQGQAKIVFLEPQVHSTFPDIIVVYFLPELTKDWCVKRRRLSKDDIRLLHYLIQEKTVERTKLKTVFPSNVSSSLRRLLEAELITYVEGTWCPRPIREIFAVQRLVAIEAKVKKWQEGLRQAFYNTWFASESYLLLPELPSTPSIIDEAEKLGVGLLTARSSRSKLAAKRGKLPISYFSWLFNEWAWQALNDS